MDFYCFTLLLQKLLKAVIFYIVLYVGCHYVCCWKENLSEKPKLLRPSKRSTRNISFEETILSDLLQEFARLKEFPQLTDAIKSGCSVPFLREY